MEFETTSFEGLKIIHTQRKKDPRGYLLKTFHAAEFTGQSCEMVTREQFITVSHRDVVRGMHFQIPPADHDKLIYCFHGSILDVVVDLRKSRSTYGKFFSIRLSADCGTGLFVPSGFAHGFLSLEDHSAALYNVSSVHHPKLDLGIRWDSFGFDWPVARPIVSERDCALPSLAEASSSFA
jgi:dTDP-4-dehydrorhamnose 3,5-epimerase